MANNPPKIALIGQPNSGKSSIFRTLADIKVSDSGSTFDVRQTEININFETYRLVDLPGLYSLNPTTKSERFALDYLLNEEIDLIINVVDSSILARSLELTVELTELGMPTVVALNMIDESENQGISVDSKKLETLLGVPVVPTQALFGKGVKSLARQCASAIKNGDFNPNTLPYTHHIETSLVKIEKSVSKVERTLNGSDRFFAIKALEYPEIVPERTLDAIMDEKSQAEIEFVKQHKMDISEIVSYERHHHAMSLAEQIQKFQPSRRRPLIDKFDNLLLHPVYGVFFLGIFFTAYFFVIFFVGNAISGVLEAPLESLTAYYEPLKADSLFLWHTVNGAYLGITGVVGIILPYFLPLVLLTSIFEETGYIERVAFIVDGLFHKIGLHGKSVAPFILGFGCSVPAIYATRMIERKSDRIVSGALIPFIPCSARIAVIFALTAAFAGPVWAFIVFAYVLLVIGVAGKFLSKALSKPMGLILEIPKLRAPSLKTSMKKTWAKIGDFSREALVFLVVGSVILGWIEFFDAAKYVDAVFAPIVSGILGLPEKIGGVLVFGFFRKELIIVMITQALGVSTFSNLPLTFDQVIVFIIFVTLYFPCFSTFIALWREFGAKVVALSAALSVVAATISAFLFKIILAL